MNAMEKITEMIRSYLGNKDLVMNADTDFVNDLKLSSLDMITLGGEVEDAFGIEIDDEMFSGIHTVGDLVKCLPADRQ